MSATVQSFVIAVDVTVAMVDFDGMDIPGIVTGGLFDYSGTGSWFKMMAVIRKPRMQGRPLRLSGSMVMMWLYSIF